MLRFAAFFQVVLVFSRTTFSFFVFISSTICLYHSAPIEKCYVKKNQSYIFITQDVTDAFNTTATLLEGINSFLLISAVFCWKIFNIRKFFSGILRIGHSWVWFLFCITNTLSILHVNIVNGTNNATGNLNINAIGLILEMILQVIFASAINFIARETYLNWVDNRFRHHPNLHSIFGTLYRAVLVAYFIRNLGLFLYDTALVSMSISLAKGTKVEERRDWDSLLLLLSAAFRGSLMKFFFEKLFQGQQLPLVCENEEERQPILGPGRQRDRLGGYQCLDAARFDHSVQMA